MSIKCLSYINVIPIYDTNNPVQNYLGKAESGCRKILFEGIDHVGCSGRRLGSPAGRKTTERDRRPEALAQRYAGGPDGLARVAAVFPGDCDCLGRAADLRPR